MKQNSSPHFELSTNNLKTPSEAMLYEMT